MKGGCNHPMGPLALADLVGLEIRVAPWNWPVENLRTGERAQPADGVTGKDCFVLFG